MRYNIQHLFEGLEVKDEDVYINEMEKAYNLVDGDDDYEEYDDSWDDYDDDFDYPEVENKIEQFYGVDGNGNAKFVALSKEEVQNYAKNHPEEDIVEIENNSGVRFNLYEALRFFDKKQFRENASSYELEMLYESVKTTLSAQQKNDLAKFVRKARTAEEINTYMTGMLVKDEANESLEESSHFEYGDAMSKANQVADIIDSAKDKDGKEVCIGSSVIVPQGSGYSDRQANVEDIFINKHNVEMLRVKYNDSKTENVAAKSCTLIESLNEEVDEEATFNKVKEIAYELDEYIEDKVWVRDFWYDAQFDTTISFEIYGDWKHDHARFNYYASEWLDNKGLDYKMWETITDDDGSDSYGATHTIRLFNLAEEPTEEELTEGVKQDRANIINDFISYCKEKFEIFGGRTDAELDIQNKFDTDIFWNELKDACRDNNIYLDLKERQEYPGGGVYLYFHITDNTLDEGYISQKDPKFSNGSLKDFDPDDLMQKVMDTGQNLHSVRKCGDDYYIIFIQYKDFFGPKGSDNPDADYILDIIKEDPSGNQDRILLDNGKSYDIIERLHDWKDEICALDDMKKNAAMPY